VPVKEKDNRILMLVNHNSDRYKFTAMKKNCRDTPSRQNLKPLGLVLSTKIHRSEKFSEKVRKF
jgi:hypothetical protein